MERADARQPDMLKHVDRMSSFVCTSFNNGIYEFLRKKNSNLNFVLVPQVCRQ